MATNTKTKEQTQQQARPALNQGALAVIEPPRLPYLADIKEKFPTVDAEAWRTLVESIFPNATSVTSVFRALAYCRDRNLDIMKRPVHIVPIWQKGVGDQRGRYVDTIWPGITEVRTTAFRTKGYAGCDEASFGPEQTKTWEIEYESEDRTKQKRLVEVKFPEWCRITVYRDLNGVRCQFVGPKVYWLETYATVGRTDIPNEMWTNRPWGQLEKCAEAAALRKAFPEELGNELINDEIGHQPERDLLHAKQHGTVIEHDPNEKMSVAPVKPVAEPEIIPPEKPKQQDPPPAQQQPAEQQPRQQAASQQARPMTDAEKTEAWIAATAKRFEDCRDLSDVIEVRKNHVDPYNDRMPADVKTRIRKIVDDALARHSPPPEEQQQEDTTDTSGTTDEPPF